MCASVGHWRPVPILVTPTHRECLQGGSLIDRIQHGALPRRLSSSHERWWWDYSGPRALLLGTLSGPLSTVHPPTARVCNYGSCGCPSASKRTNATGTRLRPAGMNLMRLVGIRSTGSGDVFASNGPCLACLSERRPYACGYRYSL